MFTNNVTCVQAIRAPAL